MQFLNDMDVQVLPAICYTFVCLVLLLILGVALNISAMIRKMNGKQRNGDVGRK